MGFSVKSIDLDFSSKNVSLKTAAVMIGYNQQYPVCLLGECSFRSKRFG